MLSPLSCRAVPSPGRHGSLNGPSRGTSDKLYLNLRAAGDGEVSNNRNDGGYREQHERNGDQNVPFQEERELRKHDDNQSEMGVNSTGFGFTIEASHFGVLWEISI